MKLLATLLFAIGVTGAAFAQLPNGATAPDFTAKDLNGRTWNLYDILETGRPVIMDISATWCGPCWSYHNGHALENYWDAHGPEGDGTSFVFFVEGDGATNKECLYGPTGCVGGTQGNWVAGTPYPILDNAQIASSYDISYYPTVYLITPDKKVSEIGQQSAAALWAQASQHVGNVAPNLAKVADLKPNSWSGQICLPQTAQPTLRLANFGSNQLTSATIELRWNNTVVQTKNWTGNLPAFEEEMVTFDLLPVASGGKLSAVVVSTNNDATAPVSIAEFEYVDAPQVFKYQQVVMKFQTDGGGRDIYWEMIDDAGNVLQHGGNEAVGPNGGGQYPNGSPAHPTAYGNFKLITDTLIAPASGCFSIRVVDGAGNGLTGPGRYRLYNIDDTQNPTYIGTGFQGSVDVRTFAPDQSSSEKTPVLVEKLNVYPNPAQNDLTLDFQLAKNTEVSVMVTNTVGQVVKTDNLGTLPAGSNQYILPIKDLSNGTYFLNVRTENGAAVVRKFTVLN